MWGDEGFSAIAVMKPFGEMLGVVMRDTAPPLFYTLGWIWVRLVGTSEAALRSLPLILTIGTAIFGGLIVWRVGKNRLAAVLGGLVVLGNPFLNQYAFEWRMYAMLAFTIAGSTYFWLTKRWKGYVILTLAALYTHHFALFTVAAQALVAVGDFTFRKPKILIKQLAPYVIVGVGYVPWLYPMYLQTVRVKGAGFWLMAPKLSEVLNTVYKFIVPEGASGAWKGLMVAAVVVLIAMKDWRGVGRGWVKLLIVFGAPVAIAAVVSHLVTPVFYDRYLLSVSAGMAILIALGSKKKTLWALAGVVVMYGGISWRQFTHPKKLPFRELAAYVKNERRPEDRLVNYNGQAHHLWESKYYGIGAPIYVPGAPLPLYVGTAQMTTGDTVKELPDAGGRLGVIASERVENINLPGYKLIKAEVFDRLTFSWWKKTL